MKRILRALTIAATASLALTGCIRMDSATTLYPDDTGDQFVEIAFANELLSLGDDEGGPDFSELLGSTDDLKKTYEDLGFEDVVVDNFENADESGIRVTIARAPLSALNNPQLSEGAGTPSTTITRIDDTFRVDVPAAALMDSLGDQTEISPAQFGTIFDITTSVTFPGPVLEHTGGTVEGNTITWTTDDMLGGADLYAIGSATAKSGLGMWLWVGLGLLILAAGAVVVVLQSRKAKAELAGAPAPAMPATTDGGTVS